MWLNYTTNLSNCKSLNYKTAGRVLPAADNENVSQVVVTVEFRGIGDFGKLAAFLALSRDEVFQQRLGEHAASGEIIVIRLQSVQRILQTGGQTGELRLLLLG